MAHSYGSWLSIILNVLLLRDLFKAGESDANSHSHKGKTSCFVKQTATEAKKNILSWNWP